jgi:hypothetical protein
MGSCRNAENRPKLRKRRSTFLWGMTAAPASILARPAQNIGEKLPHHVETGGSGKRDAGILGDVFDAFKASGFPGARDRARARYSDKAGEGKARLPSGC